MQQTQNYKLNLIETTDPFSPAPLNENTQKLEAALADVLTAAKEDASAKDEVLADRITVLELHKVAIGTYTGTGIASGSSQIIKLGFTPACLFLMSVDEDKDVLGFCLPGHPYEGALEIVPGGFKAMRRSSEAHITDSANSFNHQYFYAAFC